MKTWTQSAEERLEGYLRERGRKAGLAADDLAEVTGDWRNHIHEEVERSSASVVSLDVLEPVLARMGSGDGEADPARLHGREMTRRSVGLIAAFGVVVPFAIIVFEWLSGFCASVFFSPVETWVHALILVAVPAINWWCLSAARSGEVSRPRTAAALLGFAALISLFYAWLYVPLIVPSVLALLLFGLGLLSLVPIIVFFVTLSLSRACRARSHDPGDWRRYWWSGVAAGFLVLVALEGSGVFTRINFERAASDDPVVAERGVSALRVLHDEETLLQACYEGDRGAMATDISGWLLKGWSIPFTMFGGQVVGETNTTKARELYYRVTGRSFNTVKPPMRSGLGAARANPMEDFEWDDDLGGEQVGVRVKGVSLEQSRLDASLDGVSGLGYCEWTTVFRNTSGLAREARFQMQLPPGGVASRVTLWVNGEPREAAFASKAKVRKAYTEVAVVRQRDPVLVTASGPDRVLVQCFPIPANGGEMKIRIGVTSPLRNGTMLFPRMVERNFSIPASLEHAVWLQSEAAFGVGPNASVSDGGGFSLQYNLPATDRFRPATLDRPSFAPEVFCRDPFAADEEAYLTMTRGGRDRAPLESCVVVIDGSRALDPEREELVAILEDFAASSNLSVIFADDTARLLPAAKIGDVRFSGGRDNVPALIEAVRQVRQSKTGAVVWVHGPQPMASSSVDMLSQVYDRASRVVPLYSVPVGKGPNLILKELFKYRAVRSAPTGDDLESSLRPLLQQLLAGGREEQFIWKRSATPPEGIPETSDQLARWWAADQIREASREQTPDPEKVAFAAKYQIVTAFSGAVVLETAEQYARHGLKPVDAKTTPSIPAVPEPSVPLLVLLSALLGLWHRKRE